MSRSLVRAVLALVLLTLAYDASAQTPGSLRRVGVIHPSGHHQVMVEGLREGLRELGLEEGKQFVLDARSVEGDLKAVTAVAQDLERAKVDLVFTITTPVTVEAKRATTKIPMVFYTGGSPVEAGLVASLAKPGGRLTGIQGRSRDLTAKRLEVMKSLVPKLTRVVTLYGPDATSEENARATEEAARRLGVQLVERRVKSIEELRQALPSLAPRDVQAYFHTQGALVTSQAQLIIDAARTKRLPTMFHETGLVERGALAAYGQNYREIGRLAAKLVQRILAGSAPKDLPVENYDKIGLALNLRTAREIGLTIPAAVRALADTVVE